MDVHLCRNPGSGFSFLHILLLSLSQIYSRKFSVLCVPHAGRTLPGTCGSNKIIAAKSICVPTARYSRNIELHMSWMHFQPGIQTYPAANQGNQHPLICGEIQLLVAKGGPVCFEVTLQQPLSAHIPPN
jgi:hypothetical protein